MMTQRQMHNAHTIKATQIQVICVQLSLAPSAPKKQKVEMNDAKMTLRTIGLCVSGL
jgi:hypothetical protein